MSAVDPMDELFDELWSMEYRISGDKPRAKELAREFLDRHAHLLAERLRAEATRIHKANGGDWESGVIVNEWDAAADFVDPEVTS